MTALVEAPRDVRSLLHELLRAVRPQQWVKNVLVLAAPAAAGVLLEPTVLGRCVLAVLAVIATASGCYLVNDVRDLALDRAHPKKCLRPIASGQVPVRLALGTAVALMTIGFGLALTAGAAVLGTVVGYAALTLAYAAGLKAVPVLEMALVASGFLIRTLAGAAAARVPVSGSFLLVVSAAAVLVVSAKRSSELQRFGSSSRPVLGRYSPAGLRLLRRLCSVTLVVTYIGWALTRLPATAATMFALASAFPLVTVVTRWNRQTNEGATGAPEEILVSDRVVRWGVLTWALLFCGAVLATSRIG